VLVAVGFREGLYELGIEVKVAEGGMVMVTVGEKVGLMDGDTEGFDGAIVGQIEGLSDVGE